MGNVQEILYLTIALLAYIIWGVIVLRGNPSTTSHVVALYMCVAVNVIFMIASAGTVIHNKSKLNSEDYLTMFIVVLSVIIILITQYYFFHQSSPPIYIITVFICLLACLSLILNE